VIHEAVETSLRRSRPDLDTAMVEPRSEVQRRLADLWCRLLMLDRVGIHDPFAELGGDSLQAAHLFVEIEASFGARLPMTTILEAPTVERLAECIEDETRGQGRARRSLHLLRPGVEGGPSLFLVHDGDGETLLYLNIARRMPADVTVYGIRPLTDGRSPILHSRIADMAAHYVSELRQACPEGPYHIGGMCAGGVIAFEMAAQLLAQGHPVGFVSLLDSVLPGIPRRAGLVSGRRWSRFRDLLASGGDDTASWRRLRTVGRAAAKVRNLIAYEATSRFQRRLRNLRFRLFRSALDRSRPVPRLARGLSVRSVYEMAERDYRPTSGLSTPVLLFRATEGRDADAPFARIYADPELGWRNLTAGDFRVIDQPGGHSSMLQEPYAAELADGLRAALVKPPVPGEQSAL
jgi:thioesterase domain-containing protein/acyl carrier protein